MAYRTTTNSSISISSAQVLGIQVDLRGVGVNGSASEIVERVLNRLLWFSYRRDFKAIGKSGFTCDAGWGCMLRAAQMLLGNALLRHFARDFAVYLNGDASGSSVVLERQLLAWFEDDDSDEAPLSIHRISLTGAQLGTSVGTWFGPNFASDVIVELFKMTALSTRINRAPTVFVTTSDATIYRDELERACSRNSRSTGCLLLIPNRLGLNSINTVYLSQLRKLLTLRYFAGAIGGRTNGARFFVGITDNDDVLCLDPHSVQASFHSSGPMSTLSLREIDPSIALAFYCANAIERSDLLTQLESIATLEQRSNRLTKDCGRRSDDDNDDNDGDANNNNDDDDKMAASVVAVASTAPKYDSKSSSKATTASHVVVIDDDEEFELM